MKRLIAPAAMLTALILSASAAQAKVTIAGDPCSVPLIAELAKAYSEKHKDFSAEVSSFSCTLGVYKAADGEAQIGVSTQNGLYGNLPKGAVNRVAARSPIVLIVNKGNPVDGITYAQLKGIFSGKIKNWKEVGGPDLKIANVMLAPCVKHTMGKQVALYGEIDQLLPDGKVNPVEHTNKLVIRNAGAIGQQIYGYESGDVKILKIDGVLPEESTLEKEYTFYQDFNVVTRGEPTGEVRGFMDFIGSDEGGRIMRSLRHIPVKAERP